MPDDGGGGFAAQSTRVFVLNILLTGAHGFTGHHFTTQAQLAGHTVIPLEADLCDPAAVSAAVSAVEYDAVVHLAAISFVGHADNTAFYAVNVVGTTNLLQALVSKGNSPQCVLVASSANIYGNCDASPIDEAQPPAPVNHYAASKLAMEHMARTFADRLPIVITRPFNYTGPGQGANFVIPKLVDHFFRRAPRVELGNLKVEREFNDVRFVADAYLGLLALGKPGEAYNICTGNPYTLQQVIDRLSELTGHRLEVQVNPAFVRANEVRRLCGSPEKLVDCVGPLAHTQLAETLRWMLGVRS